MNSWICNSCDENFEESECYSIDTGVDDIYLCPFCESKDIQEDDCSVE